MKWGLSKSNIHHIILFTTFLKDGKWKMNMVMNMNERYQVGYNIYSLYKRIAFPLVFYFIFTHVLLFILLKCNRKTTNISILYLLMIALWKPDNILLFLARFLYHRPFFICYNNVYCKSVIKFQSIQWFALFTLYTIVHNTVRCWYCVEWNIFQIIVASYRLVPLSYYNIIKYLSQNQFFPSIRLELGVNL